MNQDLANYISQARATGMADDEIKQKLSSQGWQESDISEAFGTSHAPSAAVSSATGITNGIFTTKFIVAAIVILLSLGVGAYLVFFFGHNTSAPSITTTSQTPKATTNNTSAVSQNSSTVPFHCNDLLPAADFERITGKKITDYPPKETISGGGASGGGIGCLFAKTGTADIPLNIAVSWTTISGIDESTAFELYITNINNGLKSKNPPTALVKVQGVGSEAYFGAGPLLILSSNKKYMITAGAIGNFLTAALDNTSDSESTLDTEKEVAKIIDANLNKY